MSEATEANNVKNEDMIEEKTEPSHENNGKNDTDTKEELIYNTMSEATEANNVKNEDMMEEITEPSHENNEKNDTDTKEESKDIKNDTTAILVESNTNESTKEENGTNETVSKETLQNIANRLQFFFSDVNLRSDRFMNQTMSRHQNAIPLDIMLRFKTIQQYTTDPAIIQQAVEEHCCDFLRITENGIGRITPYDGTNKGTEVPLTLVVDNLPISKSGMFYDVTVTDVIGLFQEFGKVALVRLRYKKDYKRREQKNARGSAFVEFSTQKEFEAAKADLIDGSRVLVLKGKELGINAMADWLERKNGDSDKEECKNDKERKDDDDEESEEEETKKEHVTSFEKGGVISLKGVPDDCTRESILSAIQEFSFIWKVPDTNPEEEETQKSLSPLEKRNVYIDYSKQQPDGAVRFTNSCIIDHRDKIAELAQKLKVGDVKINDKAVEDAFVLEGVEEEEYWKKVFEFQKRRDLHSKRKKNFRGGRYRNKRQRRS